MDKEAKNYYDLNKRTLEFRNSKEYFIGDRIYRYYKLLKGFHIIKFITALFEDTFRVIIKKKSNPIVKTINFDNKMCSDKIAVYTAIYGNYDKILNPLFVDPMCDYFIFTDLPLPKDSVWKKFEKINFPDEINSNFLKNRYVKLLPHDFFKNYRYSIYVDGNIQIVSEVSMYINVFVSSIGIGMHKHPSNIGIYEEVKYNVKLNKISKGDAAKIKKMYKHNNMPNNFGMFECNVIIREHNNPKCIEIMEHWWRELMKGVKRDQLYFTFVLFILGYKFEDVYLIGENINANPMFIKYEHQ